MNEIYNERPFYDFVHLNREIVNRLNRDERAIQTIVQSPIFDINQNELQQVSDYYKNLNPNFNNMGFITPSSIGWNTGINYSDPTISLHEKLENFLKFLPNFVFCTDYWNEPIITAIKNEPELFEVVTNMKVSDFEHLVELGVFNETLMDDVVFKYKILSDGSLSYTGFRKYCADDEIGLFSGVIPADEYREARKKIEDSKEYLNWSREEISKEYFEKTHKTAQFILPTDYKSKEYKEGSPVIHPEYGLGTITDVSKETLTIRYLIIGDKICGISEAQKVLRIREN